MVSMSVRAAGMRPDSSGGTGKVSERAFYRAVETAAVEAHGLIGYGDVEAADKLSDLVGSWVCGIRGCGTKRSQSHWLIVDLVARGLSTRSAKVLRDVVDEVCGKE